MCAEGAVGSRGARIEAARSSWWASPMRSWAQPSPRRADAWLRGAARCPGGVALPLYPTQLGQSGCCSPSECATIAPATCNGRGHAAPRHAPDLPETATARSRCTPARAAPSSSATSAASPPTAPRPCCCCTRTTCPRAARRWGEHCMLPWPPDGRAGCGATPAATSSPHSYSSCAVRWQRAVTRADRKHASSSVSTTKGFCCSLPRPAPTCPALPPRRSRRRRPCA